LEYAILPQDLQKNLYYENQWYGNTPPAAVVFILVSDRTISFATILYIYTKTLLKRHISQNEHSLTHNENMVQI